MSPCCRPAKPAEKNSCPKKIELTKTGYYFIKNVNDCLPADKNYNKISKDWRMEKGPGD